MLKVVVEGGGGSEVTYDLKKSVISVGASSTNDIVIRSPGVAPTHIVFQRSGTVVTFLAQSRQVVVLNGERRARGVIRPGDRVRIGSATLVVEEVEAPRVIEDPGTSSLPERPRVNEPRTREGGRQRSEVVLYTEPSRLASARDYMSRSICGCDVGNAKSAFAGLFSEFFPERRSMLAALDEDGCFDPVFSTWSGEPPRLPGRTFEELSRDGRFAHLRMAESVFLIFPVERRMDHRPFYLVVETMEDERQEDELLLGELARMILMKWPSFETSELAVGEWELQTRKEVERVLPGTSAGAGALRDGVVRAASSHQPVLISGRAGSGRTWVSRFIARMHPMAEKSVRTIDVRVDGDEAFRLECFGGSTPADVFERFDRGSALVIRNIHRLSTEVQDELAEVIASDLRSPFGPSLRWMATSEGDAVQLSGVSLSPLLMLFNHHLIHIPEFAERREDLPVIILGLIETIARGLGKPVSGIDLVTLGSLLAHGFDGQTTELIRELTRLVGATPSGDVVRGVVPAATSLSAEPSKEVDTGTLADVFMLDDLKIVIPAVERVIIDRVLHRTLGNQSKAARDLNLSRGALIAKMKDYSIPDYRYLRRNS